ncbi:hypothetical protein Tco_0000120 [Tanacetum coccineum]
MHLEVLVLVRVENGGGGGDVLGGGVGVEIGGGVGDGIGGGGDDGIGGGGDVDVGIGFGVFWWMVGIELDSMYLVQCN